MREPGTPVHNPVPLTYFRPPLQATSESAGGVSVLGNKQQSRRTKLPELSRVSWEKISPDSSTSNAQIIQSSVPARRAAKSAASLVPPPRPVTPHLSSGSCGRRPLRLHLLHYLPHGRDGTGSAAVAPRFEALRGFFQVREE